jgi:hypothetical protein
MVQKGILTSLLALSLVISPGTFFAGASHLRINLAGPFYGYPVLKAICSCESNLSHYEKDGKTVLRGKVNRYDVGICQINEYYHEKRINALGVDIYTENGNITYAKDLFDREGESPWIWSKSCWGNSTR